ncbi:MAG: hypothetical protein Q8Q85_14735 [Gemmatimonadales bacterium]|nr:hypothetical protein [Gemmatimonadales bacterium]
MAIDVERARRETPGCVEVLHLNNAGASLMPRRVLEAVKDEARGLAQMVRASYNTEDEVGRFCEELEALG